MRIGSHRWWIGSALALAAGLLLLAGWITWGERRTALDHAHTTAHHLVDTLEQHASRTMEAVDYALRLSIEGWADRPPGPLDAKIEADMLRRTVRDSPALRGISMFGPDGRRLFSSDSFHTAPIDISKRPFFIELHDRHATKLVIGTPVQSLSTGTWVIPVARGLYDNGIFAGAMVAAVKAEYFVELYGDDELGETGTISLVSRAGVPLARMAGHDASDRRRLGDPTLPYPTLLSQLASHDRGAWDAPGLADRSYRLFSFRASANFPIVAVTSFGRDEALAGWRAQAWRTMLSAGALAVLIVIFTLRLVDEMTRSKNAYSSLSRAEARLRDAIDVLPEHLMIYDSEDRLVMCNEAVKELGHEPPNWSSLGLTFKEILCSRLASLSPVGRPRGFLEARLQHHRNPISPIEIHTPAGRMLRVTERRTAEGGIVSLRVDVTELRKLANELHHAKAEAERANLAKSEFLTALGHEIRTPLTGIIGFAELLLDSDQAPQRRAQIQHIRTAAQALLALANDMLDLSKIEAGRSAVEIEPFDIDALLEDCVALVSPAAAAKGLALISALDPAVPHRVVGAAARLRQVLLNLLGNAVKFTDEGEVALSVQPDPETGRIAFAIRDTGTGIAAHEMPYLFQRFVQLGEPVRHAGGSGLGLSISRTLVELMGGEIGVESELGHGSIFRFAIPLEAAPDEHTDRQRPAPMAQARILLAEDALVNQELAKAMLANAGHHVDIVGDGAAAVSAVLHGRYDLVLMDMQLPHMDGLAATRAIRRQEPHDDRTPIIALTAGTCGDEDALDSATALDGRLAKPFTAARLLAAVAPYAGRRSRLTRKPDQPLPAE